MLTNLIEDKRMKCHKYWPDIKKKLIIADNYDKVEVDNFEEKREKGITVRKCKITSNDEVREVNIVHYEKWPDFGVPEHENFAELRKTVNSVHKDPSTPLVVHCSAGVGRTGTYCTIDIILEQLDQHITSKNDNDFEYDIFSTVRKLKNQRTGMVQTKSQYVFCYEMILKESLQKGLKF